MTSTLNSDTEAPELKVYPRSPLRGPVTAWFSSKMREEARFPKYHLDKECTGLERVPLEHLASETYDDAFALGEDTTGRPCRMCSLERVLYTVLRPRAKGNRGSGKVFATFTSQSCPTNPDERLHRYRWRESSESGQERLVRVAEKLGLPTVYTSPGPVSWGFLPVRGAEILSHNLRTELRPEVRTLPTRDVIECAWALLDDNPPQLRDEYATGPDPWELARLLVG